MRLPVRLAVWIYEGLSGGQSYVELTHAVGIERIDKTNIDGISESRDSFEIVTC